MSGFNSTVNSSRYKYQGIKVEVSTEGLASELVYVRAPGASGVYLEPDDARELVEALQEAINVVESFTPVPGDRIEDGKGERYVMVNRDGPNNILGLSGTNRGFFFKLELLPRPLRRWVS